VLKNPVEGASEGLATMGRQTADQARLFFEFHLDERVPADHRRQELTETDVEQARAAYAQFVDALTQARRASA
jgi:hypothetical protein